MDWLISSLVLAEEKFYDYKLDTYKEQYPLDGQLIQNIVEHYQDMKVNFAIPEMVFYMHLKMMN
mgnify:CR=1 FL=1